MLQAHLNNEKRTLSELKQVYTQALKDCEKRIKELSMRTDMDNIQSIVYQKQYQQAIKGQLEGILEQLHSNEFATVSDFLARSYQDGFTGAMYDIAGQGIPLIIPIDQEQVVKAIQTDTKLSKTLYNRLGEDVNKLKTSIRAEVSRGIANGATWNEVAGKIAQSFKNTPFNAAYNNAVRIARTEGHRIQIQAADDAQHKAKDNGADIVKMWNASLDGRTRKTHRKLDGQIRELDEPFEVDGKKAMRPADFGDPAEDVNCRCALLQRARWALDESELDVLKSRAEYYGLDKTDSFEDYKKKYLKASESERVRQDALKMNGEDTLEKAGKSSTIKAITIDDFEDAAIGNDVDKDVLKQISSVIKAGEDKSDYYINEVRMLDIPSNKNGKVLMQISPEPSGKKASLVLELNRDLISGRTLEQINENLSNSFQTVCNTLEDAANHEAGHAKLISGLSTEQIKLLYKTIEPHGFKGISIIADEDGVEAFAEIEAMIKRNDNITDEMMEFYNKCLAMKEGVLNGDNNILW